MKSWHYGIIATALVAGGFFALATSLSTGNFWWGMGGLICFIVSWKVNKLWETFIRRSKD